MEDGLYRSVRGSADRNSLSAAIDVVPCTKVWAPVEVSSIRRVHIQKPQKRQSCFIQGE